MREPPSLAIQWLLDRIIPIFGELHRPRRTLVSWAEYDDQGHEAGFHELEKTETTDWSEITEHLARLEARARGTFAVSCLFISLDTAVIGDNSVSWVESSAELQVSIPVPETVPEIAGLRYATYIDVWLSATCCEDISMRSNQVAAARNRPRLEALLNTFSALV